MTATINGVGTHYYGKKNLTRETGVCEFCGKVSEQLTYETGLYFVVIFVPIIPLGRKQILDYCSVCNRHRVIPAKEWAQIREQAIGSSVDKLSQGMDDPVAAIGHLQTLTAFKQFDEARELAPAIQASHNDNVDVQFMLGGWFEKYGDAASADQCFDRAWEIDPTHPGSIRAKAVGLMQKGQLAESRELMKPLQPPSEAYDPEIFFLLAMAFQQQNQHNEALELFELLYQNSPELAKVKDFKKAVKKTEKLAGRKVLPKGMFG